MSIELLAMILAVVADLISTLDWLERRRYEQSADGKVGPLLVAHMDQG